MLSGLRVGIIVAIGAASLLTLLVGVNPSGQPGARSPSLHAVVETAAIVIAGLAAMLVYGRYTRGLRRDDLVLAASLAVFAVTSLGLSAASSLVGGVEGTQVAWAGVLARGLGAALMTAAAFLPKREVRRPGAATRRWLGGCALALAGIATAVVLAGDRLPAPVAPGGAFAGHPAIVVVEAAIMALFAAAALGFTTRAAEAGGRDGMVGWFAIGAILAAFAQLNNVIYPSVLTDWFAAGDALRLGFFLCLLVGGAAEIQRAQRALTVTAVLEERRRIARDLHDGAAQDLAFIVQVGRRLNKRADAPVDLAHVVSAAQSALESTRDAIADLARPGDEPLTAARRRTAEEVAGREGARSDVVGDVDLQVPSATREALCRLVREAVTNAIRHGGARTVSVTVEDVPELRVRIGDDGRGFDLEAARGTVGGFGLAGMGQRVAQLGGELRITSWPGEGTEVLVVLP